MGIPIATKKGAVAFAVFVLFFALCISGVAAYYSIVGLMAIFAGAAMSVAVMGGALEVGKLVAASWLYNNWDTAPILMKSYLTMAIVVLMFITSMGIFGFLSKAHLEQVGPTGNHKAKIEKIEYDIVQQEKRIKRSEAVLAQLETGLKTYFDMGYVTRGLKERAKQKEEREALDAEIADANKRIDSLSDAKFEEEKEILGIEAEVGPIKYIAALVYDDKDEAAAHQDDAVRWMIMLLIFVFDPLAVLLVIAGNMSLFSARNGTSVGSNEGDRSGSLKKPTEPGLRSSQTKPKHNIDNSNPSKKQHIPDTETKQSSSTHELADHDHFNDPSIIATDSNGNELPVKIPAQSGVFSCDIDSVIDDVLKNSQTGFNFDGPDGKLLRRQLAKALRKNKV